MSADVAGAQDTERRMFSFPFKNVQLMLQGGISLGREPAVIQATVLGAVRFPFGNAPFQFHGGILYGREPPRRGSGLGRQACWKPTRGQHARGSLSAALPAETVMP